MCQLLVKVTPNNESLGDLDMVLPDMVLFVALKFTVFLSPYLEIAQ